MCVSVRWTLSVGEIARIEMSLELCFNFSAYLLHNHVFCTNDDSCVFIDEHFENGVIRYFKVLVSWLRKERVGFRMRAKGRDTMNITPHLQEGLVWVVNRDLSQLTIPLFAYDIPDLLPKIQ